MTTPSPSLARFPWQKMFSAATLDRGRLYALEQRVTVTESCSSHIMAQCTGSGRQRYQQRIVLIATTGNLSCTCSCPVGIFCKHCAAVLFHAQQSPSPTKTASTPPAPGEPQPRLPGHLLDWLRQLPQALAEDSDSYPKGELSRLYYQLIPNLEVEVYKVRLRKDGSLADASPYYAMRDAVSRKPRFMRPVDLSIAQLLLAVDRHYEITHNYPLDGLLGGQILELLLDSNRLFLDADLQGTPLQRSQERVANFAWQPSGHGYFRPHWQFEPPLEGEILSTLEPLYYLDEAHGLIGRMQHELPPRLAGHLARAPMIGEADAKLFSLTLGELTPRIPAPQAANETRIDDLQPIARLSLGSHQERRYNPRSGRYDDHHQHVAGLCFVYANACVHGKKVAADERVLSIEGANFTSIARHPKAERALRNQLEQLGFQPARALIPGSTKPSAESYEMASDDAWLTFSQQGLPELRRQGWQIDIKPGFMFDFSPVEAWYAELDEAPEHEWFDLSLGIIVDGQRISLLPVLLGLIRRNPQLLNPKHLKERADDERLILPLDAQHTTDRRPLQVALPLGRLKPILATLGELLLRESGTSMRMARADAARLANLDGLPLEWRGGERLRKFARKLRDCHSVVAKPPAGLRAELRPYQLEGLGWMQTLRELEVGGILGDDMGLGKTLQSLAHLLTEKHAGRLDRPSLAVMPTSLIPNWLDEAARFAPQLRVLALHGPQRQADFARLGEFDLLLTTYALLPRDLTLWRDQPLHVLILDEAQYIKNPASKAAQAARQLEARQRLCLSGTPLENHLGELWSLFHFLMPGWLGDAKQFNRDYRTPIEKHGAHARLDHLNARIKPFLLRRKKESVARELPKKTEIVHWVELNDAQRDRYETVRLAMDQKVRQEIERKGLARSQIVILEALLKLRQVCCDLRLVKSEATSRPARGTSSGKLDSLLDMLEELLAEGRRVLLFSQFTSMLALIEEELRERMIDYVQITGATTDRRTPVRRFQNGEVALFLISLKAGGTGLNLTAADTVIHYDPWWNPAAESQATDRAYRIGQEKPVFVYKLIARGTVEEKIQQLQQRKAALAAGVLETGERANWQLQPGDIDALFAPLP